MLYLIIIKESRGIIPDFSLVINIFQLTNPQRDDKRILASFSLTLIKCLYFFYVCYLIKLYIYVSISIRIIIKIFIESKKCLRNKNDYT